MKFMKKHEINEKKHENILKIMKNNHEIHEKKQYEYSGKNMKIPEKIMKIYEINHEIHEKNMKFMKKT